MSSAPRRLLILEADDKFAKALSLYFRGTPWAPVLVETPAELLAVAKREPPDVFLVSMDVGDSATAMLRELGDDSGLRDIPVVRMSSRKEDRVSADDSARLGVTAFLKKPFFKAAILEVLDGAVAGVVLSGGAMPEPGAAYYRTEPAAAGAPTATRALRLAIFVLVVLLLVGWWRYSAAVRGQAPAGVDVPIR